MRPPNIVLIMTDTQGANMISAYGAPVATPNIDHLAQNGILFSHAYTTCPLCTPARAGLFSGMYPHTSGPWTNNLAFGDNIKTLGQRFSDAGYLTAYIGKWHLDGHDYFGTGICPVGWDDQYWYDGRRYLDELSEAEITLWRSGLNSYEDLVKHKIKPEFTWAYRITNRAIDYVQTHNDQPFVLVVSYDEPHHPFTCPPEFVEPYLNFDYPLGPGGLDPLTQKPEHQKEWAASVGRGTSPTTRDPLYFGCNAFVDTLIGQLIDAVRQFSPSDTYIVYTSDHGEMLGAHQLTSKGPVMYEEITHIPLIIQPPEPVQFQKIDAPVSHIDLLPTFLEWAGMPIPEILEGNSLVRLMNGPGEDQPRAAMIEFNRYEIEHDSWGGFLPVRCIVTEISGKLYKLVINLLSSDELYDLTTDPAEVNNLIDRPAFAELRDDLHTRLINWMYEKRDPFRGPVWERRPWRTITTLTWKGQYRPRPADGYAPEVCYYDTGLPTHGPKVEFGKPKG